jgi:hypothetical protein
VAFAAGPVVNGRERLDIVVLVAELLCEILKPGHAAHRAHEFVEFAGDLEYQDELRRSGFRLVRHL